MLDGDLTAREVNAAFYDRFEVIPGDTVGRRIYELGNRQWDIPDLRRLLEDILANGKIVRDYRIEQEFERIGRRIMLVNANRVGRDGDRPDRILMAISDVTEAEQARVRLQAEKKFAEKIIDAVRESLLVLDWDLRVESANESFYDLFRVRPAETEGRLVYELGHRQWDIPPLRQLLEKIIPKNEAFDDFEVEHEFPRLGKRTMLLNARRIDHVRRILLAIRDVTGLDFAEELEARGVPVVLATGHDWKSLPERFAATPKLIKPITDRNLRQVTARAFRL